LDEVDNDPVQRSAAHSEIIDADNPQTPEEVINFNIFRVLMPPRKSWKVMDFSGPGKS